ncbi:molecular chaperone HtpG [Methylocystis sp. WRRC1]|uniref:molecular chaperone HtpG n=1 Tax=Methylocystis sp. WRRC1 TaxID=1732014 RepID=UPI001D15B535|nr:molecular chaperone HtpG [Methylocystis sp. WRRC1]MCC3244606.1 molecular chaperone HtpG [Methylocystis sp. WRRC1]
MTDDAASADAASLSREPSEAANFGFEADVAQLLELMTHSVYSEREVFLRELISNAADACEKLRYESLSNEKLAAMAGAPLVTISLDKEKRTITVADNGVGMSRDELISALGAIANSGTRAFLEKIGKEGRDAGSSLIGRFGVGFYSVFMVADNVEVATRRAGEDKAWLWTSQGKGTYSIAPLALEDAPPVGARVTLHLNSESDEFLEPWRIESIVREHSGAVSTPIDLVEEPGKEPRRIADGVALWTKPKSEITEEQYLDFYRQLSGQFDEPALTVHWRAEGRTEYTVLAFIPGSRPFDLFDPGRKSKSKLYVRRVLISREVDLMPAWLRFVRIVVDSADIPLNVSREMVQKSPVIASIGKAVATRILQELTKLAENEPEKFAKVWENFDAVLKEGLHEDPSRRDGLFAIARFASTKSEGKTRTLKDYVADLRENQTAIYYIAGDDAKRLAASPQLEGFRARGIEVLLLDDAVDSFWVTSALGFDGKPFKSVTQGQADIDSIALLDEPKEDATPATEVGDLVAALKETLAENIEDVRVSTRLTESAACLVASDRGLDRQLERILAESGQKSMFGKPVLEINPRHAAIAALAANLRDKGREGAKDGLYMLLDLARVADGETPVDPVAFTRRLSALIAKDA